MAVFGACTRSHAGPKGSALNLRNDAFHRTSHTLGHAPAIAGHTAMEMHFR